MDLLITGRIATLRGDRGPGWAEALLVRGGRVVAAGAGAAVAALAGAGARHIALGPDEVALPGLTDSHLHLAEAALARRRVDLEGCRTIEELVARVAQAAAHSAGKEWIEGAGWDADSLPRWPTADDLEAAAPGRRVAIWAHDHHALLTSHRALADAGVDDATANPAGGVIRRDQSGRPTGVLHETAARLVTALVPLPTAADLEAALAPMVRELVSLGVVAAHDPGGVAERADLDGAIAAYRALAAKGALGMRVHACIRPEQLDAAAAEGLRSGTPLGPDPLGRLRMGWLKTFADGSLGSRTAALTVPLRRREGEEAPPNGGYGVWMTEPSVLAHQVARAAAMGISTQIHGIGDAAVRAALDALAPVAGRTPLMPRVEHTQFVDEADIPRFADLGVAASMQPIHVRSDAAKARLLWGRRGEDLAYAFARLDAHGTVIAFGTDAPVEPVDPWTGLACAVTRSSPEWPAGTEPYGAANALSLWRAIRAACVDPAITAAEGGERGRLIEGHRADVVVIPAAAVTEPVEVGGALWHARPRLVLLDGEVAAGDAS